MSLLKKTAGAGSPSRSYFTRPDEESPHPKFSSRTKIIQYQNPLHFYFECDISREIDLSTILFDHLHCFIEKGFICKTAKYSTFPKAGSQFGHLQGTNHHFSPLIVIGWYRIN